MRPTAQACWMPLFLYIISYPISYFAVRSISIWHSRPIKGSNSTAYHRLLSDDAVYSMQATTKSAASDKASPRPSPRISPPITTEEYKSPVP